MATVSLVPVPADPPAATCASCGAALVADQRYCLACGQPCSPVRLAFLDVLEGDEARSAAAARGGWLAPGTIEMGPAGYAPVLQQGGSAGWLRRYSGLLGLLSVLLMCLIVGLLVGHWVTQGKSTPGPQVVKIEGLGGLAATAGTSTAASAGTPAASTAASGKASAKEEAEESKEAAKETKAEKAPPPAPVKVSPTKLNKLTHTTGKQHTEEVNALGSQPIETG
jgi:hypothetical protein